MPFSSFGQYSNEWINFNQSYYKISVANDGLYRITYNDLQSANFPVNSVDPRLIKLYHRGKEQAILVQGESDAVFNSSDYIEFYGQRNDGTLDKNLYQPASSQPHPYYNLYSDTTAYFLTYSLIPPAGKRMQNFSEVNVSNLPKEVFHTEERLLVLGADYSVGYSFGPDLVLQNTFFDQAEGWFSKPLQPGISADFTIDLVKNGATTEGVPKLELLLIGRDQFPHTAQIQIGGVASALRTVSTVDFFGFETPLVTADLDWNDFLSDGKTTVRVTAGASVNNRFQLSTAYIKISFPQDYNLTGVKEKVFRLAPNNNDKSYVEFDNPPSGARLLDITDVDNISTIGMQSESSKLKAIVPSTFDGRKLLLTSITQTPISIKQVGFRSFQSSQPTFIVITNRALMKAAGGYPDVVKAYAGYRSSAAGGKYDTLTVTVDQLYNQFNYGETSSLAIFEFMKYMVGTGNPHYLFIIGKGREIYGYSQYRRLPFSTNESRDLVPTAGVPASDAAFTAGLGGTTFDSKVSTGRLPATTPEQVAVYLNKIMEIESASVSADWKKRALHLSGGISVSDLPEFRGYMDGFKAIAEGNYWGGQVQTIAKQEANKLQLINVSDQINKGTNLVTFFGHSSPGTIDIDIGFATDPVMGYNNAGKYPVFLINGCNAGAFFSNGAIFGEDWVLAANKGARNFIAHSSFGLSNTLKAYTTLLYEIGFADSVFLRKGIGEVQQKVSQKYLETFGLGPESGTQVQQMILLGDPAVKLFGTNKPDYTLESTDLTLVSLDGASVTSLSPEFGVRIIRKNIGATGTASLPVRIIRTLPDNSTKTYDSIFSNVLAQDTVIFKMKREANSAGINQFAIILDPLNGIVETNELNNSASLLALLSSNSTKNLLPANNALINKQTLNLVFQATDLNSTQRDFQIQLDSVNTFDSPFLVTQKVSAKVLGKLAATLAVKDSTTYYWRTKFDKPSANESADWSTSSFTFIANSPEGWGQLKFPQLMENEVSGLLKDLPFKKLSYLETTRPISVTTYGSTNATPFTSVSFKIDGVEYNIDTQGQPCRNNTINLVAFSKNSVVPYAGIPFNFQDPRTCGRQPQLINSFILSELETSLNDDLAAYVDAIQESDSVVLFSIGNPGYQSWSNNVKTKLGNFGISTAQINSLLNGEPVIILGRKGASPGTAKLIRSSSAPATAQTVSVNKNITGRYSSGSLKSALIGPAKTWVKFIPRAGDVEPSDEVTFSIYGVSLAGTETLLFANITFDLNLDFIDPERFPYLRVVLNMRDEVNLSAVQLRKWLVHYETVAEGILVYKGALTQQSKQEGEFFSAPYGFVNYSEKTFAQPLTVRSQVVNKTSGLVSVTTQTIPAPIPGDTSKFNVAVDTKGKIGLNDVTVFVNPKLVPEQVYDNNVLTLSDYLSVTGDVTAPILTVLVDGRLVKNGDYVSTNPKIVVQLADDNQFLFRTDTMGIKLFLKRPCLTATCSYERIYFKRTDVTWSAATADKPYQMNFNPETLTAGKYALRAEGVDASGNSSGVKPFEIEFKVANTTSIQLLSAYPNPSTAEFYFSFLVGGAELPSDFSLQIYGLDGRLIKEYARADVSTFIIGTNELIWNGTDASGSSMPNGVYVYRLNLVANGKSATQTGRLILAK
ncbi:MAG: hypothetical protein HYZ44_17560 [Bacteroidetes bacterium]|nr:hypothetical protein [Bacteroidota bacterium]